MDAIEVIFSTSLEDEISTVSAWDAFNGTLLCRYRGGGICSRHGLASSGGYLLSCIKGKPMLYAWPFNKQHSENKRLVGPGKVRTLAFSQDGCHIALAVDEKVFLYQTSSGKQLGIGSKHFQPINIVKFCDDGTLLGCGGQDGLLTVWNISVLCSKEKNPEPLYSFSEHTLAISDMVFASGNTRSRLISISADRTFIIHDLISGNLLLSIFFDVELVSVALSPVEMEAFVGNGDGGIHEVSLRCPPRTIEHHLQHSDRLPVFEGHKDSVTCLLCTVDCCHLISGSLDGTVKIWQIQSRLCIQTIVQKGPVSNILNMLLPKSTFSHEFKPSVRIYDFINPINVDEDEEPCFDITISEDLMCPAAFPDAESTASGSEVESLKQQIDKLKSINNAMYRFAVTKVIEKGVLKNKVEVPLQVSQSKKKKST